MKRILAATDFSVRSDRAIRRAVLLAKRSGASITLVHVVDDDKPERIVKAAHDAASTLLNEQVRSLRRVDGIDCHATIVLGDPFEGIAKATGQIAPDMLVLGPHRRRLLKDVFIGTTAERTIRAARRPVLMANGVPAGFYRHILIAVDFSECSRQAIRDVRTLGLHRQAAVSVVHVYDTPASGAVTRSLPVEDQIRDYLADENARAAEALAAFLSDLDFSPDRQIVKFNETSVSDAICSAAREASADLISVGTHGRTGLSHMMLGSVAEGVLRSADRDVLAIPPSAQP